MNSVTPAGPSLPRIERLHERHPGFTEAISQAYAEAAAVCLSRHHSSPRSLGVSSEGGSRDYTVEWSQADDALQRAYANRDDATEFGAYGLALSAAEAFFGLLAVSRADVRTGADYYLAAQPSPDSLENLIRLEVSGTDRGTSPMVARRLREKVEQLRRGDPNGPAFAVAVGFQVLRIMF